jgi:hypothetical protein
MIDLEAEKTALLARLKDLQTQIMQLDNAREQVRQEIAKTVGVLEFIAKHQPALDAAPSSNAKKQRAIPTPSDG